MGVPELLRAISITFGIHKVPVDLFDTVVIDVLYFDLASLIHLAAQEELAYGQFEDIKKQQELAQYDNIELMERLHVNIGKRIAHAIHIVKPQKLIYLAMDGVPVYAKSVQQRWRRFAATRSLLFDSNSITPGTQFLDKLADWLRSWIAAFSIEYTTTDFVFTDHTVPGEAEHKIAANIRQHQTQTHVIHGLDTDLFLISLLLTPTVYVWNEQFVPLEYLDDKPFKKPIRNNDKNVRRDISNQVIDINAAKAIINKRIGTTQALASFVVGTLILGNDFLPRNKSLEDFVASLRVIVSILREGDIAQIEYDENGIPTSPRILWKPFMRFLLLVAKQEDTLLIASGQYTKNPLVSRATSGTIFYYDHYATMYREDVARHDKDTPEIIVKRYLELVAFVFVYYSLGTNAVNKRLFYDYYYAPLLGDLARIAPTIVADVAQRKLWLSGDEQFLNPYHHLVAVLPLHSLYLLPKTTQYQLRNKITHEEAWSDLYPIKVERDIEGYAVEHVGPVFVPFMPPHIAETIVVPSTALTEESQYFSRNALDIKYTNTDDEVPW